MVSVFLTAPYPLKTWWFEFTPQVTVLYGLNGSGKTHLLRALSLLGNEGIEVANDKPMGYELITKIKTTVSEKEFNELPKGEFLRIFGNPEDPYDSPFENLKLGFWASEIFEAELKFAYKRGFQSPVPGELDGLETYEFPSWLEKPVKIFLASMMFISF